MDESVNAKAAIRDKALALGFDIVGFSAAESSAEAKAGLAGYLARYRGGVRR